MLQHNKMLWYMQITGLCKKYCSVNHNHPPAISLTSWCFLHLGFHDMKVRCNFQAVEHVVLFSFKVGSDICHLISCWPFVFCLTLFLGGVANMLGTGERPGTDVGMYVWNLFILVVPDPFPHLQPLCLALFFIGLKVYFTQICIH